MAPEFWEAPTGPVGFDPKLGTVTVLCGTVVVTPASFSTAMPPFIFRPELFIVFWSAVAFKNSLAGGGELYILKAGTDGANTACGLLGALAQDPRNPAAPPAPPFLARFARRVDLGIAYLSYTKKEHIVAKLLGDLRASLKTMASVDQLIKAAEQDEKVPQVTDDIRERKHSAALALILDVVAAKITEYPGITGPRLEEFVSTAPYYELVKTEYPLVLSKAINQPDELPTLRKMVSLIAAVEQGSHTQHSASVAAGTLLKERYIDPLIPHAEPAPRAKLTYSQWRTINN